MTKSLVSGEAATAAHESPEHLPEQDTNWKMQAPGLFGSRAVVLPGLIFFIFSLLMSLCCSLLRKLFKGSDANEQVSRYVRQSHIMGARKRIS